MSDKPTTQYGVLEWYSASEMEDALRKHARDGWRVQSFHVTPGARLVYTALLVHVGGPVSEKP